MIHHRHAIVPHYDQLRAIQNSAPYFPSNSLLHMKAMVLGECHPILTTHISISESHFDGVSGASDWDRIHAVVDPACAGLPGVIHAYDGSFRRESGVRLDDLEHTEEPVLDSVTCPLGGSGGHAYVL
jgi:hypothetical protein